MIPLTDKELEQVGLDRIWSGFAFWNEEGDVYLVAMHNAVIQALMPNNSPLKLPPPLP